MKNQVRYIIAVLLAIVGTFQLQAQTADDALQYARTQFGGTARNAAVGGAFGALGADFSSVSGNPAGLGMYRKSSFNFTPSIFTSNTDALYLNSISNDNVSRLNISSAGLVIARKSKKNNNWRAFNFAIGTNRIANFNRSQLIQGLNTRNSLLDAYAEQANGIPNDQVRDNLPFGAGLAYFTYLINPADSFNLTSYQGVTNGMDILQGERITQRGGIDEISFAGAANYMDRLYLGFSVGVPNVRLEQEIVYEEGAPNQSIAGTAIGLGDYNFIGMREVRFLQVEGGGINGKFGLGLRATDFLRLGAYFHSPTRYNLSESFNTSITSTFASFTETANSPDFGFFDYQLVTPWRTGLGAAFIIKKIGFISADYEFVDYTAMRYIFNNTVEEQLLASQINQQINNRFTGASNFRLGAEVTLGDKPQKNNANNTQLTYYLRAGYAYYGSPYQGLSDFNTQFYTGGFGVRINKIFLDLTYVRSRSENFYFPYSLENEIVDPATITEIDSNIMLNFGFTFK